MEYESSVRDEGLVAPAAGATHVGRLMHLRVEVVPEVGLAMEGTLAVGAGRWHVANGCLAPCLAAECLKTRYISAPSQRATRGDKLDRLWCRGEYATDLVIGALYIMRLKAGVRFEGLQYAYKHQSQQTRGRGKLTLSCMRQYQ